MKLLVCIKQVPDLEARFRINAAGTWYAEEDLAWRMNEYDEYAVEEAVRLRERHADGELVVLSIGPERVREALKKALAMGADRAVHVRDAAVHERDPRQVAGIIAEYARPEGFDAIFTGLQSQDRGSAQVGVLVAGLLGIAAVTTVVGFACDGGSVTVRRELEGGSKAQVQVSLPALFTCQLGLNTPRYPTLPNIMKAKKKEIAEREAAELLRFSGQIETVRLDYPQKKGGAQILEGDPATQADALIALLRDKTALLR